MAGKGEGAGGLEKRIIFLKYLLFSFNLVSFLIGTIIFCLALWVRFEPHFQDWVAEMKMQRFYTGVYILMAAGLIVMTISFFGCCGTIMENTGMISLFAGLLVFCFVLELAGAGLLLANGVRGSSIVEFLEETLYRMIHTSDYNVNSARVLKFIYKHVECCGAISYNDYKNVHKPIPAECRDEQTGVIYKVGCVDGFSQYLESKSGWISGAALILCLIQIAQTIGAVLLVRALNSEKKQYSAVSQIGR